MACDLLLRTCWCVAGAFALVAWPPACVSAPRAQFADDDAFGASVGPRTLHALRGPVAEAAFSADGRLMLQLEFPPGPDPTAPFPLTLARIEGDGEQAAVRALATVTDGARDITTIGWPGAHVCLSVAGSLAITPAGGGALRFWYVRPDSAQPLALVATETTTSEFASVAMSRDGTLALAGTDQGDVSVWHIVAGPDGTPAVSRAGTFKASPRVVRGLTVATLAGGRAVVVTTSPEEHWTTAAMLWRLQFSAATGSLEVQGTPLESGETLGMAQENVLLSPDGRWVAIGSDYRAALFRLDAQALTRLARLDGISFAAAFSSDWERHVAAWDSRAYVSQIATTGVVRLAEFPLDAEQAGAGFVPGVGVVVASKTGAFAVLPERAWQRQTVGIGSEVIAWEPPPALARAEWSELEITGEPAASPEVPAGAGGLQDAGLGPARLRVHNAGRGTAYRVAASLVVVAPQTAAAPPPRTIHFGTIAPGATVVRTLPALRIAGEAHVTLKLARDGEPALAPLTWHQLPRLDHDTEQFDRHAHRVFEAARDVMREVLGDPSFDPKLERLPPDEIGFKTSFGGTIGYQNPYTMSEAGLELNRGILLCATREELLAEMELMLDVYIPHEMVHAARAHLGHVDTERWLEEYIANLVEAPLMERVLAKQPTTPYTVDTFRRVYPRYVERIATRVDPATKAQVERLIATAGGSRPALSPADMFDADVATYVYVGARIAEWAVQIGVGLEWLRAHYLVPPPGVAPR